MIEHWIKRVVYAGAALLIFAGTPRAARCRLTRSVALTSA